MSSGMPKREIQPPTRAWTHSTVVIFRIRIASGHRVLRSMMVMMYHWPQDSGSGPTMLILICENLFSGTVNVSRGTRVCFWTFDDWHSWHSLTQVPTWRRRPCHMIFFRNKPDGGLNPRMWKVVDSLKYGASEIWKNGGASSAGWNIAEEFGPFVLQFGTGYLQVSERCIVCLHVCTRDLCHSHSWIVDA